MLYFEKLKILRKKLRKTQIEMAAIVGVDQSTVSAYERGVGYPCPKARKKYLELALKVKMKLTLEELIRE